MLLKIFSPKEWSPTVVYVDSQKVVAVEEYEDRWVVLTPLRKEIAVHKALNPRFIEALGVALGRCVDCRPVQKEYESPPLPEPALPHR